MADCISLPNISLYEYLIGDIGRNDHRKCLCIDVMQQVYVDLQKESKKDGEKEGVAGYIW